jgi:hypothetical protein
VVCLGWFKVVFENEKVRVLEVTIKPGEKEFHEHHMALKA